MSRKPKTNMNLISDDIPSPLPNQWSLSMLKSWAPTSNPTSLTPIIELVDNKRVQDENVVVWESRRSERISLSSIVVSL